MRELTIDEIEAVAGAGFFGDLWRGIVGALTASTDFLGFDGHFGYQGSFGGGGGSRGNVGDGRSGASAGTLVLDDPSGYWYVDYGDRQGDQSENRPSSANSSTTDNGRGPIENFLISVWNLPNTAAGLLVGGAGYAFDHAFGDDSASVTIEDGIVRFTDDPFNISALTLGYVQIYGEEVTRDSVLFERAVPHEMPMSPNRKR